MNHTLVGGGFERFWVDQAAFVHINVVRGEIGSPRADIHERPIVDTEEFFGSDSICSDHNRCRFCGRGADTESDYRISLSW